MQNWETLIAERTEMHGTVKTCTIEDPGKRNSANLQKKWKHEHRDQVNKTYRIWAKKNPEKIKVYQQRAKPAIKKWAEEHHERRLELNRKSDRKRATDPKRIAWKKEYSQRPEVIERRRESDRKRNQTPERKEYFRLRDQRRREAKKAAKLAKEAA